MQLRAFLGWLLVAGALLAAPHSLLLFGTVSVASPLRRLRRRFD